MPGGLMGLLQLGKRSLQANQYAQNVVGNNIANVNTPGYSRQRVRLAPGATVQSPYGMLGSGVNIEGIERMRDNFADQIYRDGSSDLTRWQTTDLILQRTDAAFTENDDSGIGAMIDRFFNSWYDLSNDPESTQSRVAVREAGLSLTNTMNRMASFVRDQRIDANQQVEYVVEQINDILTKIADLNTKIPGVKDLSITRSSELVDQRDRLVDDLAKLVDIQVADGGKVGLNVYIGSINMVSGGKALPIEMESSEVSGVPVTSLKIMGSVDLTVSSGELASLLDLRDEILPGYSNELDRLAASLVDQVNTYHAVGYALDGSTGLNFFDNQFKTAESLRLSSDILNDVENIAAGAMDAVGDNTQALRIAELKDTPNIDGASVRDFYGRIINQIGEDGYLASVNVKNFEIIESQTSLQREAIMGVSLDEEMVEMIKYEQAYQASARMISTADSMIETLLSLK
ncbi:MAG: flagellar hook-associated protein FlgK [Deferribacteres bacterium]|nr:flagellar hook-associated protein FlgK [candidate division KSB1 bacterium]MCB9501963.1 flagellar hook-associated protein FlgK [Deferribacteres bacterium]